MTLGFFVSIFGILQHLTFNGKLYWFRVMRYGGLTFGPYVNPGTLRGIWTACGVSRKISPITMWIFATALLSNRSSVLSASI